MERNPYSAPTSPVADVRLTSSLEITWPKALAVWWSFVWRSTLYGFVGGAVLGGVAGAVLGASGHLDKARVAGMLAGYLAGVGLSIPALKQALEKHLPDLAKQVASI